MTEPFDRLSRAKDMLEGVDQMATVASQAGQTILEADDLIQYAIAHALIGILEKLGIMTTAYEKEYLSRVGYLDQVKTSAAAASEGVIQLRSLIEAHINSHDEVMPSERFIETLGRILENDPKLKTMADRAFVMNSIRELKRENERLSAAVDRLSESYTELFTEQTRLDTALRTHASNPHPAYEHLSLKLEEHIGQAHLSLENSRRITEHVNDDGAHRDDLARMIATTMQETLDNHIGDKDHGIDIRARLEAAQANGAINAHANSEHHVTKELGPEIDPGAPSAAHLD